MTIKFLKQWGFWGTPFTQMLDEKRRANLQMLLDGGVKLNRVGNEIRFNVGGVTGFQCPSPGEAVKFAAALNRLRRPLHLVKRDLDDDWARRVKERDGQTCVLCGVRGAKAKADNGSKVDPLTAHHWLKTKSRAGMARWARACGATVHFAEHIHTLHENPCWADLEPVYRHVANVEGAEAIQNALKLSKVAPDERLVRALWLENVGRSKVS